MDESPSQSRPQGANVRVGPFRRVEGRIVARLCRRLSDPRGSGQKHMAEDYPPRRRKSTHAGSNRRRGAEEDAQSTPRQRPRNPPIGESVRDVEAGGTCAGWSCGGKRRPGSLSGALCPGQSLWGLKTTGGGPADGNQDSRLGLEAGPEIWSLRNGNLLNGNLILKNCVAVCRGPRLATTLLKKVQKCRVRTA